MLLTPVHTLALSLALAIGLPAAAQDYKTWSDYGGSADSSQYSALSQINRTNVSKLQVAWTYPTGDDNNYSFNPLVVDTSMYVLARNNSIVAVDAVTGREIWTHPAEPGTTIISSPTGASITGKVKTSPTAVCCSRAIITCAPSMRAPGRRSSASAMRAVST